MAHPSRYFAFLRAINVGERRVSNEQLVAPFVEAGFSDVTAYQAAGNITFRCDDAAAAAEPALDDAIAAAYGFEAPVFVRSAEELRAIVESSPFTTDQLAATEGRVQLTFLREAPDDSVRAAVADIVPADDLVAFDGRHWFWLPRLGVSASALPVGRIERLVGPMTMRTLGTVRRMLSKFDD